jgi:hypothetical protein
VNLYPVGKFFGGNYAVKFDLWLNWASLSISSEHALVGINHSGTVTNRIGWPTSDGLFFAANADGFVSATAATIRDYCVYRGGGPGNIPILMTLDNMAFGPTPPLGPQFDNANPGIADLFPAKTISGWGITPAGSAGLGWVRGEVRQVNDLISFLLNDAVIAQYSNPSDYRSGTVLFGHSDNFASLGTANNFVIFDNLRVEGIVIAPVQLLPPVVSGNEFSFSFVTEPYESYTVQWATNLTMPDWLAYTNFIGFGGTNTVSVSLLPGGAAQQYFRVIRP